MTWGDVDWTNNRPHIRRHKTDTRFYMLIYEYLRPLLERLRAAVQVTVSRTNHLMQSICTHDV